jgi:hypothetical protein
MKSCLRNKRNEGGNKKGPRRIQIDLSRNATLEVVHRSEFTKEHLEAVWVTALEYKEFKQNFTAIIRRMMKAPNEQLEETDECSCRGLGTLSSNQP